MPENTNEEKTTVVGAVDGPRQRILEAVKQGKLTMGNYPEVLGLKTEDEMMDYMIQIDLLVEAGEIFSQKGRQGGLKLGPKPATTPTSLAVKVRAAFLKAKKEAQEKAEKELKAKLEAEHEAEEKAIADAVKADETNPQ